MDFLVRIYEEVVEKRCADIRKPFVTLESVTELEGKEKKRKRIVYTSVGQK